MLNQIQFHIDDDEEKQRAIEHDIAPLLQHNQRAGLEAFRRYIPSLVSIFTRTEPSSSTLLCNKLGYINIVDYRTGQVLYGLHPEQETLRHLSTYLDMDKQIHLTDDPSGNCNTVVVLGLGLGYHVRDCVLSGQFKHIIVYEPNADYLTCSLCAIDWRNLLFTAKNNGTALFLQIGKDGRELFNDIEELREHTGEKHFALYKHLNSPVFDQLENELGTRTWPQMADWVPKLTSKTAVYHYIPAWTFRLQKSQWSKSNLDFALKEKNLNSLKRYFPDLYRTFSDYTPDSWQAVANPDGEVNLCYEPTGALYYSEMPLREAHESFEGFRKRPHKDGLLLDYKGKKLRNYLHYQLVRECGEVLNGLRDVKGDLPETVKSIIFFGLGTGYDLKILTEECEVEKLFICEPNRDFFFASLFSIDWAAILQKFEESKRRLYFNIGDDGSHFTKDLLVQFQSIGPYVLANTYFYQAYYNEHLVNAVAQLREQLQVIIAMGDYFDNARFGLSHTYHSITNQTPLLKFSAAAQLSQQDKEVPVFVVGNGPSLDGLLQLLETEKDKVIIVSCGTVLQTLHRHGIKPDFHAEIEGNRSTYDWAVRIDDPEYLKSITLISCNGIHPDTSELYGQTMLAMKQGEASTVSITELFPKETFALLESSYPTVTNFVVDLFTEMGFSQLYLLGTDMGYVDEKYHHSKFSGYYGEKGDELYNYADENDSSIIVPGNFRKWVKTKYEFKVSKTVLEATFAKHKIDVYNLNDGAQIVGAQPLIKESVLITTSEMEKAASIQAITTSAFFVQDTENFERRFHTRYKHDTLIAEVEQFIKNLPETLNSREEIDTLVDRQRDFLVASLLRKKTVLFFYFNGTLNYINSILTKITNVGDDDILSDLAGSVVAIWKRYLQDIVIRFRYSEFELDGISSFIGRRRSIKLPDIIVKENLKLLVTGRNGISCQYASLFQKVSEGTKKCVVSFDNATPVHTHDDYFVRVVSDYTSNPLALIHEKMNTIYLPGSYRDDGHSISCNDESRLSVSIIAALSGLSGVLFIPKLVSVIKQDVVFDARLLELDEVYVYGLTDIIVISLTRLSENAMVLNSGDRLSFIPRLKKADLLGGVISQENYDKRYAAMQERGLI